MRRWDDVDPVLESILRRHGGHPKVRVALGARDVIVFVRDARLAGLIEGELGVTPGVAVFLAGKDRTRTDMRRERPPWAKPGEMVRTRGRRRP